MGAGVSHSGFTQSRLGGSVNTSADHKPSDTFVILITEGLEADDNPKESLIDVFWP